MPPATRASSNSAAGRSDVVRGKQLRRAYDARDSDAALRSWRRPIRRRARARL